MVGGITGGRNTKGKGFRTCAVGFIFLITPLFVKVFIQCCMRKFKNNSSIFLVLTVSAALLSVTGCVSEPRNVANNETVTTPAVTYTPVATDVTPPSTPVDEMLNVVVELPSSIMLQSLGAYNSSNGTINIPRNLYIHSYPPDIKGYYIVQFKGANPEEYKAKVTELGGEFFGFISDDAHLVKMNGSTKDKIQKLDIVQWAGIYQPAYKIRPGLLYKKGNVTLNILIFGGENITNISRKAESIGGMNLASHEDFFIIYIDGSKITEIANINEVMWIEERVLPTIQSEGIKVKGVT